MEISQLINQINLCNGNKYLTYNKCVCINALNNLHQSQIDDVKSAALLLNTCIKSTKHCTNSCIINSLCKLNFTDVFNSVNDDLGVLIVYLGGHLVCKQNNMQQFIKTNKITQEQFIDQLIDHNCEVGLYFNNVKYNKKILDAYVSKCSVDIAIQLINAKSIPDITTLNYLLDCDDIQIVEPRYRYRSRYHNYNHSDNEFEINKDKIINLFKLIVSMGVKPDAKSLTLASFLNIKTYEYIIYECLKYNELTLEHLHNILNKISDIDTDKKAEYRTIIISAIKHFISSGFKITYDAIKILTEYEIDIDEHYIDFEFKQDYFNVCATHKYIPEYKFNVPYPIGILNNIISGSNIKIIKRFVNNGVIPDLNTLKCALHNGANRPIIDYLIGTLKIKPDMETVLLAAIRYNRDKNVVYINNLYNEQNKDRWNYEEHTKLKVYKDTDTMTIIKNNKGEKTKPKNTLTIKHYEKSLKRIEEIKQNLCTYIQNNESVYMRETYKDLLAKYKKELDGIPKRIEWHKNKIEQLKKEKEKNREENNNDERDTDKKSKKKPKKTAKTNVENESDIEDINFDESEDKTKSSRYVTNSETSKSIKVYKIADLVEIELDISVEHDIDKKIRKLYNTKEKSMSFNDVRTQLLKYIKENNLIDQKDKTRINLDKNLTKLLKVDKHSYITITDIDKATKLLMTYKKTE